MALAPMTVPTLQSARLELRPYTKEDFPASAALWADPNTVKFITKRTLNQSEAWARYTRQAGHWALEGFGYFVVKTKEGQFVGEVGFGDFHRDIKPSIQGVPESGWVIAGEAQGKGYAEEAMKCALAWLFTQTPYRRTVCIIDEGHAASHRLALKLGFKEIARTQFNEDVVLMYELLAPECSASH